MSCFPIFIFYKNQKLIKKPKNIKKVENGYKDPEKISLNTYMENCLKTYILNKVEPSSFTRLYDLYKNQIKDTIGIKMIGNITTGDLQKFIDVHANPQNNDIKSIASSGLKNILFIYV